MLLLHHLLDDQPVIECERLLGSEVLLAWILFVETFRDFEHLLRILQLQLVKVLLLFIGVFLLEGHLLQLTVSGGIDFVLGVALDKPPCHIVDRMLFWLHVKVLVVVGA